MLGLKRGIVELVKHDETWEEAAKQVQMQLYGLLGETARDVQHVGSTSIKSIQAKPIIDIAVAVNSLDEVVPFIPRLTQNGFYFKQDNDIQGELFFSCGDIKADTRTHHIHIVKLGGIEWTNYVFFRDYLNTNRLRAKEYEALKRELQLKYPFDRLAYTDGKAAFIKGVLREARDYFTLGKTVTVKVDRPLGSRHPWYLDTLYPVNYGYVQDVFAGDEEEQDAYILGVDEPADEFTGKVIAIIYRANDVEDKWVVAPENVVLYEPDIKAAVQFQERYFESSYRCLYEKVCGAVTYSVRDKERRYLLIKNESGHIGFPKGHVEFGENEHQTAEREIFEETGLKLKVKDGFREEYDYLIDFFIHKKGVYFIAEFQDEAVHTQQSEIFGHWLLPFSEAYEKLNFDKDKKVLEDAERFLNR